MNFHKNSVCAGSVFLFAILFILQACSPNNVTIQNNYKKYFDETATTGSFGLFDNGSGEFYIYNLPQFKDSSFTPASTFKIVNALVGLETGKIVDEKMTISIDSMGPIRMDTAFKLSVVPYFREVARRIGKETMQHWLDSLQYGNKQIGAAVDSFWLNNSLLITPDEQLGLVKKLYFGQLPFQKRTQEIVKKVMLQTVNTQYAISYKTGLGYKKNGQAIAWVIGWIEEN
ncbi:MAG: penicillin-binding transpeptidase domain-containing protein, partial [Sediminibacterium sp.]